MSTLMAVFYILLWFILRKYKKCLQEFPYKIPMILLSISIVLSSLFGIAGFAKELTTMLGNLSKEIVLVWILWRTFESKKDFRDLYYMITVMMLFSCIYGLIEFMLQRNYLASYTLSLINENQATNWEYAATLRGYRIYSIFEHCMGAGINWSLYSVFTIYLYITNRSILKNKRISIITAIICIPCIILTKMRSPIVFYILLCSILVINKSKRKWILVPLIGAILFISAPVIMSNVEIFRSFSSLATMSSKIGGSSIALRLLQFNESIRFMKMSPLVGLGVKFRAAFSERDVYNLHGLESVVFSVMVEYGFVGIVAYAVKMIYDIVLIPKEYNQNVLTLIWGSYWAVRIMTSIPGTNEYMLYIIIFLIIKTSDNYIDKSRKLIIKIYSNYSVAVYKK